MMTQPSPFLTASWRFLVMLNYEIDPAVLHPRVPAGTELDTWCGRTYASMVGFMFLDTKLLGLPIPFHRNFEEVNLRFYVRRGDKRAVVFVKEIVPRPAIAWVARTIYGENYVHLPMRHTRAYNDLHEDARPGTAGLSPSSGVIERQATPAAVEYGWRYRNRWCRLGLRPAGQPQPMAPGSEEEFIAEHYWGYAVRRGKTVEYQVEHPPWRVWRATDAWLDCDVARLYGPEFAQSLSQPARSAFLAEGSPIVVRKGRALEPVL